jgi:hypothetical protein
MHIVVLLHQSADGSAHRDNIIVGVGREYDNSLGIWGGTLRSGAIIYTWLTARPSGDGMLQFVENLDIYQSGLTVELFHQVTQSVVYIVLGRQFEQWFLYLVT